MFEKVFEVISIKQETKEISEKYQSIANEVCKNPTKVSEIAMDLIGDQDREIFLVIVLNVKMNVIAVHKAHIGDLSSSIVSPREVFKPVILNNGASMIVAHNHPSSSLTPSLEDLQVTERLVNGGKILGIAVLDHLIVSQTSFLSLKEEGYI